MLKSKYERKTVWTLACCCYLKKWWLKLASDMVVPLPEFLPAVNAMKDTLEK